MRLLLSPVPTCLSALLAFILLACQPPQQVEDLNATAKTATTGPGSSYLFTGTPGTRTSLFEDITGSLNGSIDGQPVTFGPDKDIALEATTGYSPYETRATIFRIQARNTQFSVSMYFNGPFEAGHSYSIYDPSSDNGDKKFDPYIVTPFIRIPEGQTGQDILNINDPTNRVTITAITPEYMDIEFFFTLKKPGAVQERLNMRVKNKLNENQNLRARSAGEPFWDYTNVTRLVEGWGFVPRPAGSPSSYPSPPTTTRVMLQQANLTTPVSNFTYEGKTESAEAQTIWLYQTRSPQPQTNVEYRFSTNWSAAGWKRMEMVWPNFTGVGTYTGDQVNLSFTNSMKDNAFWRISPSRLASPTTKWQVDVQRVTPDLIEGTYTITDAPLYEKQGANLPATASVSGRFKVIYPR